MIMSNKYKAGSVEDTMNSSLVDLTPSNASSHGDTQETYSFWSTTTLLQVAPVLLVMIATIVGNVVLILMLIYKKSRRIKRVNVFIMNLAIADLAVAFITMTTEILFAAFREWVLGALLCKVTVYLQVVTLSSTTFLLTGMSIDRYQVIVRPLRSLAQRPNIKVKVTVAWMMAFVFAIPQVFIFVQEESYNEEKGVFIKQCRSGGYSAQWQRKFYNTFMTCYILLLPSGIMCYCYSKIAMAIWNRGRQERNGLKQVITHSSCSPRMSVNKSTISSSRRKVVFMTLSVILAYIVCLTPYNIISLIRIYSDYSVSLKQELAVSKTIFMLHSALNPILYGLFTLRKNHVSSFLSSFRDTTSSRIRRTNTSDRKILKESNGYKLRRGFIFLNKRPPGGTSVIIANHSAKEETNIMLRNRENRATAAYHPVSGNNACYIGTERNVQNNYGNIVAPSDDSAISVRKTSPSLESTTDISDV